jgi:acylaminoacyl-peptidase
MCTTLNDSRRKPSVTTTDVQPLVLALTLLFTALSATAGPRTHDVTAADYFSIANIVELAVAPDGHRVAWVESRWEDGEKRRNADIWVNDGRLGDARRLTFDPASARGIRWSPDGAWIYFLSGVTRSGEKKPPLNGKAQVWRVAATGGEPQPVTRVKRGISRFELSSEGDGIYYSVTREQREEDPWASLRSSFKDLSYGHGVHKVSQIWRLSLKTWRSELLVDEERAIYAFTVSPDESRVAMLTTPTPALVTREGWSRLDIWEATPAGTGSDPSSPKVDEGAPALPGRVRSLPDALWRSQAPSPYGWLIAPAWSSDGARLAFRVDFDGYPGTPFVARFDHLDAEGFPTIRPVPRPDEVSVVGGDMRWRPRSHELCFRADAQARTPLVCVKDAGAASALAEQQRRLQEPYPGESAGRRATLGDVVVDAFDFSPDGKKLAIVMGDVTNLPDIYFLNARRSSSAYTRRTRVNPQVDTWKLPVIQEIAWTSPDGTKVHGILELPPGHDPLKDPTTPLPTIIELHGGPTASTKLRLRFWIYGRTLFATRGWALLSPNYRGSTGFGDRFMTELIGHKNERDIADILSGLDHLVAKGIADPERLAVMGWSNGGYLTNCLITATTRFKAASSGAGVVDTVLQWMLEDTPGHVINFTQGYPWTKATEMQRSSALYKADRITTPTLIHVGEKDARVPAAHSRGLFRALYRYVEVPTELVVYPGEPHGLTTYEHRRAKMDWDIAWFDRYVLGEGLEDKGRETTNAAPPKKENETPVITAP